ncbi:MAG: hypothetical protein M3Z03_16270, partial [Actinomycetota bacterium]|nr:hypothetical protein [Actinomycetota bacterium]
MHLTWRALAVGLLLVGLIACSSDGGLPCSNGVRIVTSRFSGENGWHRQLIVTDGEARHAKAVTDPDDNAEAPTFSPDGSQVA